MYIRLKWIIVILGFYIIIISNSCGKSGMGCANTKYSFKIGAKAYPDRDSVRKGDSIWIEVTAPTNLTDITSKTIINYSGAQNLSNAIAIDKFTRGSVSNPGSSFAANDFNYITVIGDPVENPSKDRIREYLLKEINNTYMLKLAVVPKQTGVYSIAISNGVNVYRQSDKCTKASFEVTFQNTNQHLYLYQNNRPGYMISPYEQTHMYCFKVY